ncbi:MAG: RNA polymerase sigma factor [Oscillospiraceae bacterium]|nr:RNA polymerase sigma factor [Oscillospiraceae bacterium]
MRGFEELYHTQGRPVYRFLLALTGDEGQAEELLQETFYQAFLHIDRFEGRSSLYTWLCCIGKNAWLRECRRRSRYADTPYEELKLEAPAPTPEETMLRREQSRSLRRAVLRLEDPQREVFILHAYGGLKLKEIAALHQKSESWARVTYFRARKTIQEVLSDET